MKPQRPSVCYQSKELQAIGGKSLITAVVVAKSLGYSAPELDTCHVSHKSDVYAYGMLSSTPEMRIPDPTP